MARKAPDMYEHKKREKLSIEGNVLKKPSKPKKEKTNVHEGHRQRIRERFLKEGLENFHDHNILELLLFHSIPVKDTNEEAHPLKTYPEDDNAVPIGMEKEDFETIFGI